MQIWLDAGFKGEMENEIEVRSRWKKPLVAMGVVALVLICGLAAGTSKTDLGRAASEYEKNMADARAQGLYFSAADITPLYNIPESENGANLIASALPIVRNLKLDKPKTLNEQLVKDHWAQLEPAIAKIEEASHRPHLMFKRNLSSAYAMTFPEYSDVKQWVNLLVKMGHFSAEKGDLVSAEKYWNLACYLGNKIDDEGILIAFLVRMACLAIVEREMQTMIQTHGKNPAMVRTLQSVFQHLDQPYDMKKPLKMEHWFATSGIDDFLKSDSGFQAMSGSSGVPNEIRFGKYLPKFKIANLSRIHRAYADAEMKIPADCYDLQGVQKGFISVDESTMKQGLSYTILQFVAPVFSQTGIAMSKEIAQRNVIAQSLSFLASGADPSAGLPLKGRFALDVDGKAIRLKKGAMGWIVYSVGGDKVDDGGSELKNGKGDYAIHLPH